MRNFLLLLLGFLGWQHSTLKAQSWEFGGFAGTSFYFGELNTFFVPVNLGASLGIYMRRNFDGRICFRGGISYGHIWGTDADSKNAFEQARNLSFSSDIFEGSILMEFNFVPYRSRQRRLDKMICPYITAGASIFYYNPKTKYQDAWYELQPLGTEGQAPGEEYRLVQPAIILGGGLKMRLNKRGWSLNIEIGQRMLFTDYLDDVSGVYADTRLIEGYRGSQSSVAIDLADRSTEVEGIDTPIGEEGRQRGDSKRKDAFMMIGIGLSYNFRREVCPANQW
ncbi:MAG: DUF6089 family protein [Saprospiraceae bacterium]|nr:DUF6089 family protein [Saprospiraceae bacterium]